MLKLILLGVSSGVFFSSTFIINESLSQSGAHWLWLASLRYFFVILFLVVLVFFQGGTKRLSALLALFYQYRYFWMISGGIGFGVFYGLLCFSASFLPGWVIAATWQFTLVSGLLVFAVLGRKFPQKTLWCALVVFGGVCLVNFSQGDIFADQTWLLGCLPLLLATFCYPFGNQLVWEARHGAHKHIPKITSPLLANAFNKVLLMALGCVPLWLLLIVFLQPPAPSTAAVIGISWIAFLSGVCATSIFLYARNLASNANEIAGVDATQASEVVFALIGGILLLGNALPNLLAIFGLALIFVGLFLFVRFQDKSPVTNHP